VARPLACMYCTNNEGNGARCWGTGFCNTVLNLDAIAPRFCCYGKKVLDDSP
jgi:hypothetical protein